MVVASCVTFILFETCKSGLITIVNKPKIYKGIQVFYDDSATNPLLSVNTVKNGERHEKLLNGFVTCIKTLTRNPYEFCLRNGFKVRFFLWFTLNVVF